MITDTALLDGWTLGSFTADGITRPTYRRGSGPAVIVVHEIPGITPKVIDFANEVVQQGLTVIMPLLVGEPGKAPDGRYLASSMWKVCVSKEFTNWATAQTSPIISWLRALAKQAHAECGGPGVGALGMCFSGGFALGMMVDDVVVAPVLSQPSMPFAVGKGRAADLNLTPADQARVVERATAGCDVLGLRFTGDRAVGTRFDTLRTLLGDRFIAVELPSSKPSDHSVLTEQRDQGAVTATLEFLRSRLLPA